MFDGLSTITGFILTKFSAIFYSLGGALITLSFTKEDAINKKRTYLQGFINLSSSWFLGVVLGGAINEYFGFTSEISALIYVVSSTVGLILIGGIYKFATAFKKDPEGFIKRWKK